MTTSPPEAEHIARSFRALGRQLAGLQSELEALEGEEFTVPVRKEEVYDVTGRFPPVLLKLLERAKPAGHPTHEGHPQPSAWSRRAMADTRRDQSAVSTSSCFRPARVRV